MARNKKFELSLAVHPGAMLWEWLQEQGLTAKELSLRIGKPEQALSAILSGGVAITPELALPLEQVTGVKSSLWLAMQRRYNELTEQQQTEAKPAVWEHWEHKPTTAQLQLV